MRGGNQFTVEPPDQALCVGNGYVVEAVNDVLNVFNTSGQSVLPDNTATNIVSGFPRKCEPRSGPELVLRLRACQRSIGSTGRARPVRNRSACLYDAATQRFFVVVLTLETFPNGAHLRWSTILISQSARKLESDRAGWSDLPRRRHQRRNGYGRRQPRPVPGRLPAHRRGRERFLRHDQRLPLVLRRLQRERRFTPSPRRSSAAGAASVTMAHIDTSGMVNAAERCRLDAAGFHRLARTVTWHAVQYSNGGTEFFLSPPMPPMRPRIRWPGLAAATPRASWSSGR